MLDDMSDGDFDEFGWPRWDDDWWPIESIDNETTKAWSIRLSEPAPKGAMWFPKSKCRLMETRTDADGVIHQSIFIPGWLAKAKGLPPSNIET